eukprot:jgi/Ulvmu1/1205/UM109_0003.1
MVVAVVPFVSSAKALAPACGATQRRAAGRVHAEPTKTPAKSDGKAPAVGTPDFDSEKLVKDVKEKWDGIEDKSSVAVYTVGAITLLWLSSSLVGAINRVPLLPKMMELVGLGYTAWFVYRYLLFKESREELIDDIDELKKKISGDQ